MFIYWLLFMWQLPQHILAGFLFLILKIWKGRGVSCHRISRQFLHQVGGVHKALSPFGVTYGSGYVGRGFGVCLGEFIFLPEISPREIVNVLHEFGHVRQSRLLGPLYLLIIGIPSFLMCSAVFLLDTRTPSRNNYDYYSFYCERWADNLGNIKRDLTGKRVVSWAKK